MTPEDKALALRWYAQGFSLSTIAQHFSVTIETLKDNLRTDTK